MRHHHWRQLWRMATSRALDWSSPYQGTTDKTGNARSERRSGDFDALSPPFDASTVCEGDVAGTTLSFKAMLRARVLQSAPKGARHLHYLSDTHAPASTS